MSIKRIVEDQLGVKRVGGSSGKLTVTGTLIANSGTPGTTWFVDGSMTTSGNGKSWDRAFKTIAEAITAAGAEDHIHIGQGDYQETATSTITQEGLKIFGPNDSENGYPALWFAPTALHNLVIKAHNVSIFNMGFYANQNTKDAIHIGDTNGQAYWKLVVDGCKFEGGGVGEYAIRSGATAGAAGGPEAPDITIQNCLFRSFATCAVQANWTRGMVRNCQFFVDAGTIGIEHIPTAGNRPDMRYIDNIIMGAASTDTGIKITGTPSAGTYAIVRNIVLNCNTAITGKATNDAVCALNYVGDASGGALIDPSP
jgi:hypothetical protein